MNVLLVEGPETTQKGMLKILQNAKLNCSSAHSGEQGLEFATVYDYDLIIVRPTMPDMEGRDLLKSLRNSNIEAPVLIVSDPRGSSDVIDYLTRGADDYIALPVHTDELIARIHTIVRRSGGHADSEIRIGDLRICLDTQKVKVHQRLVNLTKKEYQILELLALRKGKVISKQAILDHMYGGLEEPMVKIVDVFVCKIRKKLARVLNGDSLIETIWGGGYILRSESEFAGS